MSCSIPEKIYRSIEAKNDLFKVNTNTLFNAKIPNIFRKCYIDEVNLEFPNVCPYVLDQNNNITTYDFRTPEIIDDTLIKSIFYYGIESWQNNYTLEENNLKLINTALSFLKKDDINLNIFQYYLLSRYSKKSLLYQYLLLTGTVFQNYEYNIINKITCNYIINWEYTYACYISGELIKGFQNYWSTNNLLLLHFYYVSLLNEGIDNLNISSTKMTDFMKIINNFIDVMNDLLTEFNYKLNGLCYCAPKYFFDINDVKNVYETYVINSETSTLDKINEDYITLNIYTYEINVTHTSPLLDYPPLPPQNNYNLDSTADYSIPPNVSQSKMYKYFYTRSTTNKNLGKLSYRLEDSSDISKFPLFYYDNNVNNSSNTNLIKYKYNEELSNEMINGNKQFYNKNNLDIEQQFIFNEYYYTSILVVIDRKKFGSILSNQDILNNNDFGKSLINNFQSNYEDGTIKIKSDNDYKTFNLTNEELNYENNVVLVFVVKNSNIISINSPIDDLVSFRKNYSIEFFQTQNIMTFTNKKNINIYDYEDDPSMLKLFQVYSGLTNPFELDVNLVNQYSYNYLIQRYSNIKQLNYDITLGTNINYTLRIRPFPESQYRPDYINILYYNEYTSDVSAVMDPTNPTSVWNIPLIEEGTYYILQLNNNYIFPWYNMIIVVKSTDA